MARFDPSKTSAIISELQNKGDVLTKDMVLQRKRLSDLDEAIKQTEREIRRYRLKTKHAAIDVLNLHKFTAHPAHQRADGVNPTHIADQRQQEILARLEIRLNKLLIRRSETENANSSLKEEINQLRRKRMNSDAIRRTLENKLRAKQQQIQDLMEVSALLNEEREAAVEKMKEINRKNEEEHLSCANECSSIDCYVAEQNGALEESIAKAAKDVKNNGFFDDDPNDPNVLEEKELEKLEFELNTKEEQETTYLRQIEGKIETYEESFQELKRVSGIDDIERLVDIFIKNEEETFSLFNYIQQVNQDIEKELEVRAKTEQQIKKYQDDQGEEEQQRAEVIKDLQDQRERALESVEEYEDICMDAQRMVAKISKLVSNLFFKIQADQMQGGRKSDAGGGGAGGGKPKSLGRTESRMTMLTGQGVTESNILQYMGIIEQRAVEIISEYTKKMMQKEVARAITPLSGPSQPAEFGASRSLRPPELEDDSSDDEDNLRPLSLDSIRSQTHDKVTQHLMSSVPRQNKQNKQRSKRRSYNSSM
uniref:ODAD1 central coiled coil region domain-containing protein n=1 Tax=Phaeomonas parva TaxID=124430 RepID=A0A7S1XQU7_9STRA|mmetsp:Transcript_26207/g.81676  ORF Transcript_26207/g.81676 Transcript_26207/m.81676 type:complete len:537 (+) Transcript_26207:207-1817(+)